MQLANGRLGTYFVRTTPPGPTSPKFVAKRKLTFLQRRFVLAFPPLSVSPVWSRISGHEFLVTNFDLVTNFGHEFPGHEFPRLVTNFLSNFLSGRVSVTVPADASFLFAGRR